MTDEGIMAYVAIEPAYVAIEPGKPGYCSIALAGPRAADDVAEWIRDGLEVRLVSIEEGVRGLREYIDARDSSLAHKWER